MTRNHRQESLCRAYIQAVVGRCGLGCSFHDFDYGVDLTLHVIDRRGRRHIDSGFKLDIQAKSTMAAVIADDEILYDMEVKTYKDLRDPFVGCPRILVLLVLPPEENQWTGQTEEHLLLRRCAYWLSLRGRNPTGNRKTVRVAIPRKNVFSVKGLRALMEQVRRRQPL